MEFSKEKFLQKAQPVMKRQLSEGEQGKMNNDLISRRALMQALRGNVLVDVTAELEEAIGNQPSICDIDEIAMQLEARSSISKEIFIAIKRQIPKKPVFKRGESTMAVDYADGHGELKSEKWAEWVCPACGWSVGQQYIPRKQNQKKCKFCQECGQAIDWEEKERQAEELDAFLKAAQEA